MIKVKINNEIIEKEEPFYLVDIVKEFNKDAIVAKVNKRLRELTYKITKDCEIEFLDLTNSEAIPVYNASIRYLISMAIHNINKDAIPVFKNSISRSMFCEIKNAGPLNVKLLNMILNEMKRIVEADYKINRLIMSKEEALEYFKNNNYQDKLDILKYRPEKDVHFNECNGYINYMYSYLVPSTSYLSKFKLLMYAPGFIIQTPRAEFNGEIPAFEDAPTFGQVLREANKWGQLSGGGSVAGINKMIEEGKELEFINLCETRHNDMLSDLGLQIKHNIDDVRLICVAGPSSSGKTTFTNRLRIELMARGINPLMISIDNYYKMKSEAPKDSDGNPDLEHIDALDVDLFNAQMFALINGEEVTLPIFDFEKGCRVDGPTVRIDSRSPILIEGIHALNDDLTPSIPLNHKFKIYIAPQAQINLDNQNPLSLTDLRLIRRIVRDMKFRGSGAEETLSMWPSVRRGEFRWIYNNQEGVNFVFNSELSYEMCVLKKYALPALKEIQSDSPYYIQANKLIKYLKYFKDIDDEWIPSNSIIREFIGGSIFYRK